MKLYRLHMTQDFGVSAGYQFFTAWETAEKAKRKWLLETGDEGTEIDSIEVTVTGQGILDALNRYASHPDNG
jgi:hypothetical protein